jgi:RNA polymerase sigma-70 factor (ECF subfamily)
MAELNPTDEALMAQVRGGDLRKLAILFERHHRRVYNFFVHMNGDRDVSEDLAQEVFFRMLRYRSGYDEKRPFAAWMYQIARNLNNDRAQRRKGELQLVTADGEEESTPNEPRSGEIGAEEALRKKQEVVLLKRALERLPGDKREILVLSRFQDLKYEEIARILGCEIGAVKVRVYRAVRALSEMYQQVAGERAS